MRDLEAMKKKQERETARLPSPLSHHFHQSLGERLGSNEMKGALVNLGEQKGSDSPGEQDRKKCRVMMGDGIFGNSSGDSVLPLTFCPPIPSTPVCCHIVIIATKIKTKGS